MVVAAAVEEVAAEEASEEEEPPPEDPTAEAGAEEGPLPHFQRQAAGRPPRDDRGLGCQRRVRCRRERSFKHKQHQRRVGKLEEPGHCVRLAIKEDNPPLDHFRAQFESLYSVFTGNQSKNKRYHRFLPVTIKGHDCSALIDSGNTWRNVISVSMMKRLGYALDDLMPLKDVGISTARSGDQLEILGELPHYIEMQLGNTDIVLPTKPVVLRDLAMQINICGPFLQKHEIDQLHSKNALRCKGRLLKLTPCESLAIHSPGKRAREFLGGHSRARHHPTLQGSRGFSPGTGCDQQADVTRRGGDLRQ